jgi:hypothetical protein
MKEGQPTVLHINPELGRVHNQCAATFNAFDAARQGDEAASKFHRPGSGIDSLNSIVMWRPRHTGGKKK